MYIIILLSYVHKGWVYCRFIDINDKANKPNGQSHTRATVQMIIKQARIVNKQQTQETEQTRSEPEQCALNNLGAVAID